MMPNLAQVSHGARALVQIAEAPSRRSVSIRQIARVQRLSGKFIERIVSALRSAGFIRPVRGTRDGYALTRTPASIPLDEVVRALGGPALATDCLERPERCGYSKTCPTREIFLKARGTANGDRVETTLDHLMKAGRAGERPLR